ncbi:DUF892 family protein [Halomarina salina]|uniref:DUF892 family protein n=1 Tax=Halomarina salina TaxID=1872699 RepID=A0ABD5RQM6_9EURY|nr:DUF892 family protein [Halomarina salina]
MCPTTTEDMFADAIRETFYAEHQFYDALERLADSSSDERLAETFSAHREETRVHILRLEELFNTLGISVEEREDRAVSGLLADHEAFLASSPDQMALDRYNVTTAQKAEHYEIAVYGNLVPLASDLGMDDVADLLEETLREEQQALGTLSKLGETFDQQHGTATPP